MFGSATLAIVVSSTCITVASMIADGDQPPVRPAGAAGIAGGRHVSG